jgi:two-component sensor histidine kinase
VLVKGEIEQLNGKQIFSMSWKESGGPVVRKPRRKGFGSTILIDGAKSFGTEARLAFEPDGLRYELRLPLHA